jgi:CshA-type fibril repeat protein
MIPELRIPGLKVRKKPQTHERSAKWKRRRRLNALINGVTAMAVLVTGIVSFDIMTPQQSATAAITPGTQDTTLNATGLASLFGVAALADGSVVATGESGTFVKFSPSGVRDTAFDSAVSANPRTDRIYNINVDASGNLVTGDTFGSTVQIYDPDGRLRSWFTSSNTEVNALAIDSARNIYTGGNGGVRKFSSTGVEDTTFKTNATNAGVVNPVYALAVQADGKILAGGNFAGQLKRLNTNGTNDNTFTSSGVGLVVDIAVSSTGEIAVGGQSDPFVKRYNSTGTSLTTTATNGEARALAYQADGKLLVGGTMTNNLMRYNADGTVDSSFVIASGAIGVQVWDLAISGDKVVVAAGNLTASSGKVLRFWINDPPPPPVVLPTYVSAATNSSGTELALTFSAPLSSTTAPASAFTVFVDGQAVTVSNPVVSGSKVTLTVSPAIERNAGSVSVSYDAPASSASTSNLAVQDTLGIDAATFGPVLVTNASIVDTQAPRFVAAMTADALGSAISLLYDETLGTPVPLNAAYTVINGGSQVNVTSVSIVGSKVLLKLASNVDVANTVTVAYLAPTANNASTTNAAIQDATGNDSATVTAKTVTGPRAIELVNGGSSLVASSRDGQVINLKLQTPVADVGSLTQSITQWVDPTKYQLSSANDVIAPSGWAITYSYDGSTFTATAPASNAQWASVKGIKATGTLISAGGDPLGRQIAIGEATAAGVPSTGAMQGGASGDGYDVIFDNRGYVYNIFHHNGGASNPGLDCHLKTGERCPGSWPQYFLVAGTNPLASSYDKVTLETSALSSGWFDEQEKELWFNTTRGTEIGFACLNLADVTAANIYCGGSAANAFRAMKVQTSYCQHFNPDANTLRRDCTVGITQANGKIFTWDSFNGDVMCLDVRANNGLGAKCSTWNFDFGSILAKAGLRAGSTAALEKEASWSSLITHGNKIYAANGTDKIACIDSSTLQYCAGWPTIGYQVTDQARNSGIISVPDNTGKIVAICPASRIGATCYSPDNGSKITTVSSTFISDYVATRFAGVEYGANNSQTTGTRVYWSDGDSWTSGGLFCWDFATNARCANFWDVQFKNYTINFDPLNPSCLWSNSDTLGIKLFDAFTGLEGCNSTITDFSPSALVPRMGCSPTGSVQGWVNFELTGPASTSYSSARLTVLDSSGNIIPGWVDIPITNANSRKVDLSTLSVSLTGQKPKFRVSVASVGSSVELKAKITTVGDAPELCVTPKTVVVCSAVTGTGLYPLGLLSGAETVSISGAGSSVNSGGSTVSITPLAASLSLPAVQPLSCGSLLQGTARIQGTNTPFAGAIATLLNAAGQPVYQADGTTPMTATTSSTGAYSFGYLIPTGYKVSFADSQGKDVVTTTGVTAASGDTTVASTATYALSSMVTLDPGTTGVVDAAYTTYASLSGRAGDRGDGGTGNPIPGVTVTLLDAAGVPVLGSNGQPITTTTASDGTYTFSALAPGAYKVKFATTTAPDPLSSTTVAGASGSSLSSQTTVVNSCSSGTGSQVTSGLNYVSGASIMNMSMDNLVVNGDFTDLGALPNTGLYYWGNKTVQSDARAETGGTYTVPYPNAGNNGQVIPGWTAAGGGTKTYAIVGPMDNGFIGGPSTGSPQIVYFGNGQKLNSPTPAVIWDAKGLSRQTLTFTQQSGFASLYGTQAVSLAQNIPTVVGKKYRIQFLAMSEEPQPNAGISALDISGYGRTYFRVNTANTTHTFEFVATQASTEVKFNGWGHIAGAQQTELVLDRVAANLCETSVTSPTSVIDTDTPGVVNALYVAPTAPIDPPTVVADTTTGPYNTAQTEPVLGDDTAASGTTLDPATLKLCTAGSTSPFTDVKCSATSVTVVDPATGATQGTYTISGTNVIFTPTASFTGTAVPVTYMVKDALGQASTTTYTPTVTPPPPAAAVPDTSTRAFNTAATITVLTNDTVGAPGVSLLASTLRLCASGETAPACTATSVTVAGGVYTSDAVGNVTFTPTAGFVGTAPAVTYVVTTNTGQKISTTYTPTILPPAAPSADNETSTGPVNIAQSQPVLIGDTAPTGSALDPASLKLCPTTATSPYSATNCNLTEVTVPEGKYTLGTDGSGNKIVIFTPNTGFVGTATPVRYIVEDVYDQPVSATYTPTFIGPPTADNETSSDKMGVPQSQPVLTGDAAASGATLVPSTLKLCGSTDTAPNCTATSVDVFDQGTGVKQGTYTISGSDVIFTPEPAFKGIAVPVTYSIADSYGQKVSATYTPTVIGPPAVVADTTTGPYNTAQTEPVLGDDTAASGTTLDPATLQLCTAGSTAPFTDVKCSATSVTVVDPSTGATQGTYTISGTNVIFTPTATFTGTAVPVTYMVKDVLGQASTTTYTPTVTPPPPAVAVSDASIAVKNTDQVKSVLSNDTVGATGVTLLASTAKLCGTGQVAPNCDKTTVVVDHGSYTIDALGIVTFTPETNYVGTPQNVTYQVTTNTGQVISSTYSPVVVDGPSVLPDTSFDKLNVVQTKSVLGNDAAAGSSNLFTLSTMKLCVTGTDPLQCGTTSITVKDPNNATITQGTYSLVLDGSNVPTGEVKFTPFTGFTGTAVAVTYQITNDNNQTVTTTYTPTVVGPPAADNETTSGMMGIAQTAPVLVGDTPGTGTSLLPASLRLCASTDTAPNCTATTVDVFDPATNVKQGTYTISGSDVIFTPEPAFKGVAVPVTYSISDAYGQKVSATYAPTVIGPPTVVADTTTGPYNTAQTEPVLGDDTAASGTTLDSATLKLCTAGSVAPFTDAKCSATSVTVVDSSTGATQGTYTISGTNVIFTPTASFTGTAVPVTYMVKDVLGQASTTTYTPTVTPPPAPVATNDTSSGPYNTAQTKSVWTNDTTGLTAGMTMIASTVKLCGTGQVSPNCDKTSVSVVGGTYTVDGVGVVTFTPTAGFVGTAPAVTYQITTNTGQVASATYTPTVTPPPVPTAVSDISSGPFNTVQTKPVLTNDGSGAATTLDPATLKLCAVSATAPYTSTNCTSTSVTVTDPVTSLTQGVYTISGSNVVFTPEPGFEGTAVPVTYVVQDELHNVVTATYTPTTSAPTPIVAQDDTYKTYHMTPITFEVGTNDLLGSFPLDPTSIRLCAVEDTAPACTRTTVSDELGTLVVNTVTGKITFTPTAAFIEITPAYWRYVVADTHGNHSFANITITDPPFPTAVTIATDLARTGMNLLGGPAPAAAIISFLLGFLLFVPAARKRRMGLATQHYLTSLKQEIFQRSATASSYVPDAGEPRVVQEQLWDSRPD